MKNLLNNSPLTSLEKMLHNPVFSEIGSRQYESSLLEMERSRKEKAYKSSGVPAKFFSVSIDTYSTDTDEERNALDVVRKFIDAPKDRVLLLYGCRGTGKTHLGASIIRELGGVYITSFRLCLEYESGIDYKSKKSRLEIVDYYSGCSVLVIDEYGCGKDDVEREILPYLISTRYENNLPTVIISNAGKKDIISHLGESVYDRLVEVCTSVEFTGDSKRKKKSDRIR